MITKKKLLYMTDDEKSFQLTIDSRKNLYSDDLAKSWSDELPIFRKTGDGDEVLEIMGHEVMRKFELPYMHKLAEIVTRNGGNILNVGYGMGLIDKEIENYRKDRSIKNHYTIELNKYIAEEARKNSNMIILEGNWEEIIPKLEMTFDGIVYDAYPLAFKDVHRDGIKFLEKMVDYKILKPGGIFTFYADTINKFGNVFLQYLEKLGFTVIDFEKVEVDLPSEGTQYWMNSHFLAPILRYQ